MLERAERASHIDPPASSHAIMQRAGPTAERTLDPARMFAESLTPRPELENSQDPKRTLRNAQSQERLDISSGSRSDKLRLRRLSKFLQRRARWREERCAGVRGREIEQPVVKRQAGRRHTFVAASSRSPKDIEN